MDDQNIYSTPKAELGDRASINLDDSPDPVDSNLASRWARLGAALIDVVVVTVPFIGIIYGTDYWQRAMNQQVTLQEQALSFILGLLMYLLLHGYLLHKRGQTIGKWVLGIKIVSVVDNEILPLWRVFFFRYLPQVVIAMIPFMGSLLVIINDLFIFRKDKRCLHDHIAGTKVVREHAH